MYYSKCVWKPKFVIKTGDGLLAVEFHKLRIQATTASHRPINEKEVGNFSAS